MTEISKISPDSVKSGMIAIIPMLIGTAPFGVIFGAFGYEMGLGMLGTQGLSLCVFAGSSQFVGASLFGQGASIIVILITTFFINLRHMLYGAAIGPKLKGVKIRSRILMSFFLTDETFAVVSRFREIKVRYYWGTALAMYFNWQLWTFVGMLCVDYLKAFVSISLGFIMVPAFLPIIFQQIQSKSNIVCAVLSVCLSLLFLEMPSQTGLLVAAVLSIIAVLILEHMQLLGPHTGDPKS